MMSINSQDPIKQMHIHVSGRVQGVFFRVEAQKKGRELGLRGFVRNLEDGSVEVVAQGDEKQVEAMLAWCRKGPENAQVRHLEFDWQELDSTFPSDFEVRF